MYIIPTWQNSSFTCNFPQFCQVGFCTCRPELWHTGIFGIWISRPCSKVKVISQRSRSTSLEMFSYTVMLPTVYRKPWTLRMWLFCHSAVPEEEGLLGGWFWALHIKPDSLWWYPIEQYGLYGQDKFDALSNNTDVSWVSPYCQNTVGKRNYFTGYGILLHELTVVVANVGIAKFGCHEVWKEKGWFWNKQPDAKLQV